MNLRPGTPTDLLATLRTNNPTAPRLTWYGPNAERVEFSGRVLENWVAKTANYLVDELDAEPGTVVGLDLPLHWRSLVWLLATWAVGATATLTDAAATLQATSRTDIVATTNPAAAHHRFDGASPSPLVVAVALPALQMRWMEDLPARTLDYCGDVRAHADVFFADDAPASSALAWQHGTTAVSYDQLLTSEDHPTVQQAPRRVLLHVSEGWAAVVPAALNAWADGGSVVLLDNCVEPTEKLRTSENISQD